MIKYIFLIFLLATACSPKIVQKSINHQYQNLIFSPEQISKKVTEELSIKITPIDAKKLDLETFLAASRGGNYEKEIASEIEFELKNIYRFNMPKELTITPSQKITKYIAIPAIDLNEQMITVNM